MNTNKLRYFLAAVETGSMSAASDTVGVTQQAVSRAVQLLEEELGVSLVTRTRSGISATPRGEQFRTIAKSIIEKVEAEIGAFKGTNKSERSVRVGVSPGWLCGPGTQPIISALKRANVERSAFVSGCLHRFESQLASGNIDFAATSLLSEPPENIAFTKIGDFRFYLTGRSEELASAAARSLQNVPDATFIGSLEMVDFEKVVYDYMIDSLGEAPKTPVRISGLDVAHALLRHSESLLFFLSNDAGCAQKFWGRPCFPVDWIPETIPYGLLTRRSLPNAFDWATFAERCARECVGTYYSSKVEA